MKRGLRPGGVRIRILLKEGEPVSMWDGVEWGAWDG